MSCAIKIVTGCNTLQMLWFRNQSKFLIKPPLGNFRHIEDGSIVAQHSGVHQWTVGQRIRLGGCKNALFVVSRDPKNHDIIVANGTSMNKYPLSMCSSLMIINWFRDADSAYCFIFSVVGWNPHLHIAVCLIILAKKVLKTREEPFSASNISLFWWLKKVPN